MLDLKDCYQFLHGAQEGMSFEIVRRVVEKITQCRFNTKPTARNCV